MMFLLTISFVQDHCFSSGYVCGGNLDEFDYLDKTEGKNSHSKIRKFTLRVICLKSRCP